MKLPSLQIYSLQIFILIIIVTIYHYYIHNGLEKIFSQTFFNYNSVKRPLATCNNKYNQLRLGCIGMPSGHAETTSVLCFLLFYYKMIPLWLCTFIIILISVQRIITQMHTLIQVIIGSILGLLYASIYYKYTFSYGIPIVSCIGLILALLCIFKLDKKVYGDIPDWVDKSMYQNIKKKQDTPLYIKIGSLYANTFIQSVTFLNWRNLEECLDEIVERIRESGINYHVVVGIKTGGAIISDYVSLKLGLPNYKIKLTRKEYNCKKESSDTIDDIIKKNIINEYKDNEFTICEEIEDNLEGKNIILIDELVSSGKTMEESYNYLKQNKYVNIVYPTCVGFYKSKYKGSLFINNILNDTVLIWPWGYDN